MKRSELDYMKQYTKDKRIRISLNLGKDTDKDILEAIEKERQGNTQAAIKSLIRKAIQEEDTRKLLSCIEYDEDG